MSETNSGVVKYLVLGGIAAMTIATAAATYAAEPGGRERGPMMGRGQMESARGCERLEARLAQIDRRLTADRVRDMIAGRLAREPEQNLKVGKVTEKDGVIEAQIVTRDGSLVKTQAISAKTGLSPDVVKNCERVAERFKKMREARGGAPDAQADPSGPRGDRERGRFGGHFGGERFGPGRFGGGRGMGPRGDHRDDLNLGIAGNAGPAHDLNLSAAQAKTLVEAGLVKAGNSRLKVGALKEKDADTITVEIVTTDNSLVARRDIDRHTGRMRSAQGA